MEGPIEWRTRPIKLKSLLSSYPKIASTSVLTDSTLGKIGLDFIPPLNANAQIIAPIRKQTDIKQIAVAGLSDKDIPEQFSWNNTEQILAVKGWKVKKSPVCDPPTQYACGSCWVWSSVTMLSDRFAIFTGQTNPNLSPTYILSCMANNNQCDGGFPSNAGLFLEQVGTTTEQCDSYAWCADNDICIHGNSSTQNLNELIPSCSSSSCPIIYKAKQGSTSALVDIRSIQLEILANGPVISVFRVFGSFVYGTMDKSIFPKADGWATTNGIYVHITGMDIYKYGETCPNSTANDTEECFMGNHAVVIVGWGIDRNVPNFLNPNDGGKPLTLPYWIVRNSWGPKWNGDGYFKIAMSDPKTGINMAVAIDRPLVIRNQMFGAVTAFLPNVNQINRFLLLQTKSTAISTGLNNISMKQVVISGLFTLIILVLVTYFISKMNKQK